MDEYLLEKLFVILWQELKRLQGQKSSTMALRHVSSDPYENYDPSEYVKRIDKEISDVSQIIEALSKDYYFDKTKYLKRGKN